MDNIEYRAYCADIFSLVRTMVIKMEWIARRDNNLLRKSGYPVSEDKRTWRYYLNLSGEYHPTDDVMTIKSIDTGEDIIFNKQNLVVHLATFREYSRGGYWLNRLLETYSHQQDLIRGILSPIPIDEAIAADDYKILRYNTRYVAWNEDQLIPGVQTWINSQIAHRFQNDYIITDNLMAVVMMLDLYAGIIECIHTLRFEAHGTRYAHDFYIWSHINSFGNYSRYKGSLSQEQTMWLYRNIAWLKNNPGKQYTFNLLLENLLTKRSIPMAKYDMVENTETQLEDLTPTPLYRRLNMNLLASFGRTASFIDTEALITKQRTMARNNPDFTTAYYEEALTDGKFSLHSDLATKALESKMQDFTNRHSDTLMTVVFNHWIYLAGKGVFNANLLLVDPKTGKNYRFSPGEAYHLWYYLVNKAKGIELDYVCPVYYQRVMRVNPPTLTELKKLGSEHYLPLYLRREILSHTVPFSSIFSPELLLEASRKVYDAMWIHKKIYSQYFDGYKRGIVQNACDAVYESGYIDLMEWEAYEPFLIANELFLEDYTIDECRNFAWDIFIRFTGWDINNNPSLRSVQRDMVDLMMELSSYTIHTITEMDDGTDLTELPNESFVAYSLRPDGGNSLIPDWSGVHIGVREKPLPIHIMYPELPIVEQHRLSIVTTSSNGLVKVPVNDGILPSRRDRRAPQQPPRIFVTHP